MKTIKSQNPVAICFDDEFGQQYSKAYLDGYSFGDRMLEGLIFEYTLDLEGYLIIGLWENQFNKATGLDLDHWLKLGLEFGIEHDIFSEKPEFDGGAELAFVYNESFEDRLKQLGHAEYVEAR